MKYMTLGALVLVPTLIAVYLRMVRTSTIAGPWRGCHEADFIFAFRERIGAIARNLYLPKKWAAVHVRFNPIETCAEFYVLSDKCIIARLHVEGEMGLPDTVIVFSDLSEDIKSLFLQLKEPGVEVVFKQFAEWKPKK